MPRTKMIDRLVGYRQPMIIIRDALLKIFHANIIKMVQLIMVINDALIIQPI